MKKLIIHSGQTTREFFVSDHAMRQIRNKLRKLEKELKQSEEREKQITKQFNKHINNIK